MKILGGRDGGWKGEKERHHLETSPWIKQKRLNMVAICHIAKGTHTMELSEVSKVHFAVCF